MSGRALVTGASGFVGALLCAHLDRQGWEVVGSGDRTGDAWTPCDVTKRDQVEALMEQARGCTHIFHLAAMTFVPEANTHPGKALEVNLLGTVYLAEAMRSVLPSARLLYIGSADAYGPPQSLPVDEDHPLSPQNPYAISKAAADQYCAFLSKSSSLDVVRMRPFNHSGPGQGDQFVLSSFARQIAEIELGLVDPVLQVGDLSAARDFSHVRDVLHAYELAALQGHPGEAYNVCSGNAQTIADALKQLLGMSQASVEVRQDPARMRPVDVPRVEGSFQKLAQHTGWRPEISFETLLSELLEDWRARLKDAPKVQP